LTYKINSISSRYTQYA